MQRSTLVLFGTALAAIGIGVLVFIYGGENFSKDPLSAVGDNQQSAVAVPFTSIASGSQSKVTNRVNYFITSATKLSELWEMVDAAGTPPEIDFNKNAVIAVFAGEQPTTGYAITVSKIEDSDARLVSIVLAKPGSNCMTGQALTAPYEIVIMPVTSLPLSHKDVVTTTSCPS